jgi:hypothetical protein
MFAGERVKMLMETRLSGMDEWSDNA